MIGGILLKRDFFDYMHTIMDLNSDVVFLMAGLGYPRVDEFLEKYPDRAFNTEASEQATLDIAVGLAYAGKIPIVYSITPFLLYRGFETIRTYINHEHLPVILVGVGRGNDYSLHDGFSHEAGDDAHYLKPMKNIAKAWPNDVETMQFVLSEAVKSRQGSYINIPR